MVSKIHAYLSVFVDKWTIDNESPDICSSVDVYTITIKWLLPPTNEVCEGYVFTVVCLSTKEGRAWQGGGVHGGGNVWLGGCAWQGGMRAPRQILRDPVNERAVRILLCHLSHGNPLPPPTWIDGLTDTTKTLPSRKLCMPAVKTRQSHCQFK